MGLVHAAAARCGGQTGCDKPGDLDDEVMVVYSTAEGKKHLVLAYRGTEFKLTTHGVEDVLADLAVAAGEYDQTGFRRRQAVTEAAIRQHQPDYVDVTGHSLGATAAMHCIFMSKPLQSHLRFAALFNQFGLPGGGGAEPRVCLGSELGVVRKTQRGRGALPHQARH